MSVYATMFRWAASFASVSLLITSFVQAQPTSPEVTNISIRADEQTKRFIILYDIATVRPGDSIYVEIQTASGQRIRPKTVNGSVGRNLTAGRNKTIYWDVVRDKVRLEDEVDVLIQLVRSDPVTSRPGTKTGQTTGLPNPVGKLILPIAGWVATAGLGFAAYETGSQGLLIATGVVLAANVAWLIVRKSTQRQSRTAWQIQPGRQAVRIGFVRTF